jgi:hypothetical protein
VKEGKTQRMGAQIESTENLRAKGEEKETTNKTKRNKLLLLLLSLAKIRQKSTVKYNSAYFILTVHLHKSP